MLKKFPEYQAPIKNLPGERWTILKLNTKQEYLISTKGRIYSFICDRILKGGRSCGIRTFYYYPVDGKCPYPNFKTGNPRKTGRGDIGFTYSFLVATHFLEKPAGKEHYAAAHINYDKLDDRVENLKWIKMKKIMDHSRLSPIFTNKQNRKLTVAMVIEMKKLLAKKRDGKIVISIRDIATKYGIAETNVFRIQNGSLYSGIGGAVVKPKQVQKRFSDKQVISIRALLAKGKKGKKVAEIMKSTEACISRIKTNKYYNKVL